MGLVHFDFGVQHRFVAHHQVQQFLGQARTQPKLLIRLINPSDWSGRTVIALVMQHLAQANPRSAVWYIDTPDALFMERDRVAMRNHSGDFVPPVLSQLSRQFASGRRHAKPRHRSDPAQSRNADGPGSGSAGWPCRCRHQ